MLNELEWMGLGVAATLVAAYVAQRVGFIQIGLMRAAHNLSLAKATPKLGTYVRSEERFDNGKAFPPFLYLMTTIYNNGDLAATNIKGEWKLTSDYGGIRTRVIPIDVDSLGSTPHELDRVRLEESGAWSSGKEQFRFDIDIELDYFCIPENQPKHYRAKYRYDSQTRQMIKLN